MQKNAKNTKKGKNALKPVYKPYLKGNIVSKAAAKRGLRILGYTLVFVFIYLLAGGALAFDNTLLRILANILLLSIGGMVMYADGSSQGEADVGFAEIAQGRLDEGKHVPDSERDLCYHPLKGLFTMLVGVLPVFAVCLVFSFVAEKQSFALGVLPSWVAAYERQSEAALSLAYYSETSPVEIADILRIIVRLINFPYITMAGSENYDAIYMVDKMAPLLCLIVPALYMLGYLRGPYLRALVHGNIRMNRRKQNMRAKKVREQRRMQLEKKNEKKELI